MPCQGEAAALERGSHSLLVAIGTTLTMTGVTNRMGTDHAGLLYSIYSVHQHGSDLVTSAEAEQNLPRRKIYVNYV